MNDRWKDELFDAVRAAQWTGVSFHDFLVEAKVAWLEALSQEADAVKRIKLP